MRRTRRELADTLLTRFNEYDRPDVLQLERELATLRDRLRADAAERGREAQS
jgi:hypothetical protein